jgi:hypothetical protein
MGTWAASGPGSGRLPGKSRGWSIRHRLVLVAAGVALPLVLLSAGIIWQLAANERTNRRDAIVYATRTLMNAVDGLLRKQIAVAEILASSPALQSDDLATFRMEAERAMQGLSGAWVVVSDADGNVLLNLIQDPATTPQQRGPAGLELQRRALQSNQPQISDVIVGPVTNTPVVAVEVPVRREGRPPLALTIAMDVRIFLPMFEAWNLPEGWLAGLIDGKGNFIARSRDHERTVGTPAAESFRDAARGSREGWTEFDSVDGIPIANAHVTSRVGNWVMAVAADAVRGADPKNPDDRDPGRHRGDARKRPAGALGRAADRQPDRADRDRHPRAAAAACGVVRTDRRARGRPRPGRVCRHRQGASAS